MLKTVPSLAQAEMEMISKWDSLTQIRAWINYYISQFMWDGVIAPCFNTLRPRRNEQHFADDIFKRIFLNENVWILIKISPKFVPKSPINNIPVLVQIMAWRRPGDKPLPEPMMVSLPTHICVTRPQWVNFNGSLLNSVEVRAWRSNYILNKTIVWLIIHALLHLLD